MANRNRLYERDAGLIVTPCTPQVIAGGLMASLAVLWTAAIAPPLRAGGSSPSRLASSGEHAGVDRL